MLSKTFSWLAALSLAGSISFADQWNKKTILTVNEPVLVPGATLEPGKYVVKLVDSLSTRHIVQFTNEREDQVINTVIAIPNYRLKPTGDTVFEWWETPRGNPKALRAWFYPGDNFGQEFAYPKGLSAKIAQVAHMAVPTTAAETPADLKTAPLTVTEPSGKEEKLAPEIYEPPAPPEPVLRADARPAPEPEPAPVPEPQQAKAPAEPQQATAPADLPKTASPFPAFGIAGLIAVAAGLALRGFVKRPS